MINMALITSSAFISFTMLASANIIFPKIKIHCNPANLEHARCLRGQICGSDNLCISQLLVENYAGDNGTSNLWLFERDGTCSDTTPSRDDNRCGSGFDGAPCNPADPYGGPCCSIYGWCGSTADYCAPDKCQCNCTEGGQTTILPPLTTSASVAPRSGNSEPIIGSVPTSAHPSQSTGAPTTDGTCGAANGETTCQGWPAGECCSMYGWCGDTTAHCGDGCQSGPCVDSPAVPAPGPSAAPVNPLPGAFAVVGDSGVPAMHAALLPNGQVVFLDKVENFTMVNVSSEHYAYSSEWNPNNPAALPVPLSYKTNAFCSGGSFLADGTVISVGGNGPLTWLDDTVGDGFRGIRYLTRSATDASLNGQSWSEPGNLLSSARWYASAQTMPDGTIFVASGSLNGLDPTVNANNNPTYEILDVDGVSSGQSVTLPILVKQQPYYMYPFVHLLNDGTLFIFVSKSSEIFDVSTANTVRTFDDLPGDYRTYPNTGGSVLLPLSSVDDWSPDIVICGGGAYQDITSPTEASCGRIQPLSADAAWELDSMPEGRGMVEGILLPDGTVLWVNGCDQGAEGFELALKPTLEVLIYDPTANLGRRWSVGASSSIPRLYHSVALLLLDGTLLIAGSNPWEMPNLDPGAGAYPYPTEFSVEIYTPPYLDGQNSGRRPLNIVLSAPAIPADGVSSFTVQFVALENAQTLRVALYHGGFVTHALHMSHRMLFLDTQGWQAGQSQQQLTVTAPPNHNVAPPGPYVVYIVVDGVPGVGQFIMVT